MHNATDLLLVPIPLQYTSAEEKMHFWGECAKYHDITIAIQVSNVEILYSFALFVDEKKTKIINKFRP